MKHRNFSLHYCSRCRQTTRHLQTKAISTCSRCGIEKPAARVVRRLDIQDADASSELIAQDSELN